MKTRLFTTTTDIINMLKRDNDLDKHLISNYWNKTLAEEILQVDLSEDEWKEISGIVNAMNWSPLLKIMRGMIREAYDKMQETGE